MKDTIVTDVDGVLLSWASNLPFFCAEYNLPTDVVIELIIDERTRCAGEIFHCNREHGDNLVRLYNNSKWFRGLKAYDDALRVINRLKAKYNFVATTAIGSEFQVSINRQSNLNVLFPGAFTEILTCDHTESKGSMFAHVQEKYDNVVCYVDDLPHHLTKFEETTDLNVPLFHMIRGDNKVVVNPNVAWYAPVHSWFEIEAYLHDHYDPTEMCIRQ